MEHNQKQNGKTFWDIISDHPKMAFFTMLLLLSVILVLIFEGKLSKLGRAEFLQKQEVKHDTIIKVEKVIIPERHSQLGSPQTSPLRNKQILMKKGNDTIVSVNNQPANINTGINNGIIGNDNKISMKAVPRELTIVMKNELLSISKGEVIHINSLANDPEAYSLALSIFNFLKENGYNNLKEMHSAFYSPPLVGQRITRNKNQEIDISVGSNFN